MTDKKLKGIIQKTLVHGKAGRATGLHNRVKEYTFKKPVGVSTSGKKTKKLRVVTNPYGQVVTAFPV